MIFDGKAFAHEMELSLKKEGMLTGKRLLIIGDEKNVYVRLKKEMGERLGVRVRIQNIESRILNLEWGDGALIQLPVEDMSILKQIPIEKDVDGLNEESGFLPAAVVAVERILESRILNLESSNKDFEKKLENVVKEVTKQLDDLKIGLAAETVYNEFWHWYCDGVIEEYKAGKVTRDELIGGLKTFLKLLHPFVPFVTEACWKELGCKGMLMTQSWPEK